MNKTIFIGGIYPECKIEEIIEKYGSLPQVAADTLQKSILYGLGKNLKTPITLFNSYFIPMSFFSFEREEAYCIRDEYGEKYNLPFIKNRLFSFASKTVQVVKGISEWMEKSNLQNEEINVIVYPAYFPFIRAVTKLKKKYKLNVCLVVPDLPQFIGLNSKRTIYNKISSRYVDSVFYKNIKSIDSFVLLTESMNEKVNIYNKPYCVIEGMIPADYEFFGKTDCSQKKDIVYSGTLQLKYGVETLLKASEFVKDKNVNFVFYGDGEGKETIKKFAEKDSRIVYNGVVTTGELHKIQQNAEILINPRPNTEEFVKYSFPSKILEYLMSARPIIAYKLSGMPSEYYDYIFAPESDSPEDLAKCINSVLELSDKEKNEFGKKAREFALNYKNSESQTKKIIDLLNIQ